MILPIIKYGDDVLRRPTSPVADFDVSLQALIDDMVDTMYAVPGVGLAANQVGVGKRLAVIDLSVGKKPGELHVLINPEIVERIGQQTEDQGGLSIPDFTETVVRPQRVTGGYLDRQRAHRAPAGGEGPPTRPQRAAARGGGRGADGARALPRDRSSERKPLRRSPARLQKGAHPEEDSEAGQGRHVELRCRHTPPSSPRSSSSRRASCRSPSPSRTETSASSPGSG